MAQLFETTVLKYYQEFVALRSELGKNPVPLEARSRYVSIFRRLRSLIKLDWDSHASYLRSADVGEVKLLYDLEAICDPYTEVEVEKESGDDAVTTAWKKYRYSLHQVHYEQIEPISKAAYDAAVEMITTLNRDCENEILRPMRGLCPSLIYGSLFRNQRVAEGHNILSREQYRILKMEESRVYLTHTDPRGDEPWFLRLSSRGVAAEMVESGAKILSGLCFGVLELLPLETDFGVNASPWRDAEAMGPGPLTGTFLTGSLIGACLFQNDRPGAMDTARLLYPPVYTVIEKEKEFAEALTHFQGGLEVEHTRRQVPGYPTAGDTGLVRLGSAVFPFTVIDGVDIDLQLCCPAPAFEEEVRRIFAKLRLHFEHCRLVEDQKPNAPGWKICGLPRTVQLYRVERPGRVYQHHVAPARGMFFRDLGGAPVFHLTPTAMECFATGGTCKDLRYVMSKHPIGEILRKYTERGFTFKLPKILDAAVEGWYEEHGHPIHPSNGVIGRASRYCVFDYALEVRLREEQRFWPKPPSVGTPKVATPPQTAMLPPQVPAAAPFPPAMAPPRFISPDRIRLTGVRIPDMLDGCICAYCRQSKGLPPVPSAPRLHSPRRPVRGLYEMTQPQPFNPPPAP